MKLRTKALLLMSIILVAANVILGAALMQQSRHSLKTLIDDHMLIIVCVLSLATCIAVTLYLT